MAQLFAQNEQKFESCRVTGNGDCINEMLSEISGASGYRELGIQIGFDITDSISRWGKMYLTDLIPVGGPQVLAVD